MIMMSSLSNLPFHLRPRVTSTITAYFAKHTSLPDLLNLCYHLLQLTADYSSLQTYGTCVVGNLYAYHGPVLGPSASTRPPVRASCRVSQAKLTSMPACASHMLPSKECGDGVPKTLSSLSQQYCTVDAFSAACSGRGNRLLARQFL